MDERYSDQKIGDYGSTTATDCKVTKETDKVNGKCITTIQKKRNRTALIMSNNTWRQLFEIFSSASKDFRKTINNTHQHLERGNKYSPTLPHSQTPRATSPKSSTANWQKMSQM
ncbi:hypothetical protein WUBG_11480, partial [Wuchereria bancrofti]